LGVFKYLKIGLFILIFISTISCSIKGFHAHFHIKEKQKQTVSNLEIQSDLFEVNQGIQNIGIEAESNFIEKKTKNSRREKRIHNKIEKLIRFHPELVDSLNTYKPDSLKENSTRPSDQNESENELPMEPMGNLSFIFGIIGIPGFFVGIGLLFSIAAIVLGAMSLSVHKNNPGKYRGKEKAKIGLWLGIIPIALLVLFLILFIAIVLLLLENGN
jgi:hypothetical protein